MLAGEREAWQARSCTAREPGTAGVDAVARDSVHLAPVKFEVQAPV